MRRSSRFVAFRIVRPGVAAVAVAWALVAGGGPARAQEPAAILPERPVRLRMTPQRATALLAASARQLGYVPGEVLIKFRDGVARDGQERALLGVRSRPSVAGLRWAGSVAVLHDDLEPDAHVLADQLRLQPEVAWAEPNYLYRPQRLQPNDPGFAELQWNLRSLDITRAWDINPGGDASLIVAVVDSGITTENAILPLKISNGQSIQNIAVRIGTNPDISPEKLVTPRDFILFEDDGPVVDFEGHGTHVAGTIGEDANNDLAEAGIAYNARLMPVKVCFNYWDVAFALADAGSLEVPPASIAGCPTDAIVLGIQHAADNGAKVINLSLGGFAASDALREALHYAVGKGAFVAIAAGNDFEEGNPVEYPAAYANDIAGVMSVGATNQSRVRAYYSGTASNTEIAAPGGDVRDGGLDGLVWQMTVYTPDSQPGVVAVPRFDRYLDFGSQGTSMAAPHVSGLAALLMSQGVTSPAAVEALIRATAEDLGTAGRDGDFGFGLIRLRVALRGFGIFTE